jgi:hypothetical protein
MRNGPLEYTEWTKINEKLTIRDIQNEPKLLRNWPLEYTERTKINEKLIIRINRMNQN